MVHLDLFLLTLSALLGWVMPVINFPNQQCTCTYRVELSPNLRKTTWYNLQFHMSFSYDISHKSLYKPNHFKSIDKESRLYIGNFIVKWYSKSRSTNALVVDLGLHDQRQNSETFSDQRSSS